jgi:hypothetical protein
MNPFLNVIYFACSNAKFLKKGVPSAGVNPAAGAGAGAGALDALRQLPQVTFIVE